MKYTDIINNASFQNIAATLRVPFRSAIWRGSHSHVPFWSLWNDLVELPGGPVHADWPGRWVSLQVALAEADTNLVLSTEDITWLFSWIDHADPGEAAAVISMLYAFASAPDETMTPAEIAEITGTVESTWRNKAARGEIPGAVKRGKQWLIPDRVVIEAVLSGMIAPDTSSEITGTTGETFFYRNTPDPLEDIGRVPGKTGLHVLRRSDGSLAAIGGYELRKEGEVWDDYLS